MTLNFSLLIVEPDQEIKSSISAILGDEFKVEQILTASTGEEALKLLADHNSIDCIIAATELSDNSGFSLISTIKKDQKHSDTSVLLMSDNKDASYILQAAACGASDLILKPFDNRSLTLKLKKLILGKQFREHLRISTLEAFNVEIIYSDSIVYDAKLLDVSKGGCYVRTDSMTPDGRVYDRVSLKISNEQEIILAVSAELIRIEHDPECEDSETKKILVGFQFDDPSDSNVKKIGNFLTRFVDNQRE